MIDWLDNVTLRRTNTGPVIVTDPPEVRGMRARQIDYPACHQEHPERLLTCWLVDGHDGPHWSCTPDLLSVGSIGLERGTT